MTTVTYRIKVYSVEPDKALEIMEALSKVLEEHGIEYIIRTNILVPKTNQQIKELLRPRTL